jgi:rod shape determining protein RodA
LEQSAGRDTKYRILSLFNPIKYAADAYQQTQGRSAIGAGEIWGYGLFQGPITQGPVSLLPEKQNDMIFAVAGEGLGFVGCMLILVIFIALFVRIIIDSKKSKDSMGSLICIGIFVSFAVQMIVNIGAVLLLFPITGISLPFFSSGGSSIVACFMAIGIVLAVYMHRNNSMFARNS